VICRVVALAPQVSLSGPSSLPTTATCPGCMAKRSRAADSGAAPVQIDHLGDHEGEQTLAGDGLEISDRASRAEHVIDRLRLSVDFGRAERRRGLDGQQ
jgi:hypothetical protein